MRKGPDYLVWLINSKCRLLFKCEAGVIWITLDSDAWRNNFWFVRAAAALLMMAHGNVRRRAVFSLLASLSLTFSVMIAPRSISLLQPATPTAPSSFIIMTLTCCFFFPFLPPLLSFLSVCLYSLPQASPDLRGSVLALRERHAGKEEGHGFYNCSSPMLTGRAAKVTHSVWLSHVHTAPRHFVFITPHTHAHIKSAKELSVLSMFNKI